MILNIKDTFNTELPADSVDGNNRRQVHNACFSFVQPRVPSNPKLLHVATELAAELGISKETSEHPDFLKVFSGSAVYPSTRPFAMCYGGHQFGNWAGQLGDGRAINLFEISHLGKHWAVQLKGSGETPYSRTADGLAVLRSSIREHLCSEAMFHLGVPTTRSLSLVLTGDEVLRDVLYNGNAAYEKGAVVCRVAPSFIRFGNFQIFASRHDTQTLQQLTDYTIRHFFPEITTTGKDAYLAFYREVVERTLKMVVHWQRVGFVHGVMNTDNMSILGLTIDYGPYGWLEDFNPDWTPNTTDAQGRRYRFRNQPNIAMWNLVQLGNALYPLIEDIPAMEQILEHFNTAFKVQFEQMMLDKLGLTTAPSEDFLNDLQKNMIATETDMTIFYRNIAQINHKNDTAKAAMAYINNAFYTTEALTDAVQANWHTWLEQYIQQLKNEQIPDELRRSAMNRTNPKYVLRNYMAQIAIDAADQGDYSIIAELYELLRHPYDEQPEQQKWFAKRPDWARHKVGCSMLSCSS